MSQFIFAKIDFFTPQIPGYKNISTCFLLESNEDTNKAFQIHTALALGDHYPSNVTSDVIALSS